MNICAIVFDLDGTLLDSLADIATAANTVLQSHGFPPHPVDAYRHFVGDGVARLMQRAVPAAEQPDSRKMEQYVIEFREFYRHNWNVQSRLYDGVADLLNELVNRSLPLAVLSNKPQDATSRCIEFFLPTIPFAAVLGQQSGRPPKPDLTGAREILQRFGAAADTCLFLGDTAVDMETARGAHMIPVGAKWGFRGEQELRDAGAEILLARPAQLLTVLDQPSSPPSSG